MGTITPAGTKGPSKLWLPVIIAVSVLLGVVLSFLVPVPPLFWRYAPFELQQALMVHVILSTVSIALLVSLAAIYLKVYAETSARFALGIVVVLFALLIQALIEYPLFLGLAVQFEPGQGAFLSYADFFTIVGYTIFLYLSLE